MLALAHHLQGAIDRGLVPDRATVARRLGLTRARVTQLLDLLLLAPDLKERVLHLEALEGAEPLSERALGTLVSRGTWQAQRVSWAKLGTLWGHAAEEVGSRCAGETIHEEYGCG
jgi:hypothetical protein